VLLHFINGLLKEDVGSPLLLGINYQIPGTPLNLRYQATFRKGVSGWSNDSCMVTSLKASEKNVGNRGSKSDELLFNMSSVKEQRVYGSWNDYLLSFLRCILMGHESVYQVKIPSNQIIQRENFTYIFTLHIYQLIYPWFLLV